MNKDEQTEQPKVAGRRNFLVAAAATSALAAAAALLKNKSGAGAPASRSTEVPEAPEASGSKGYHETQHIRKYYSSAAF